jgi:hypothetical protein
MVSNGKSYGKDLGNRRKAMLPKVSLHYVDKSEINTSYFIMFWSIKLRLTTVGDHPR